jgi:SAM-dependent methyltransferase
MTSPKVMLRSRTRSDLRSPSWGGRATHQTRRTSPGARQTGGIGLVGNLLPSPEEWAVRNQALAQTLAELVNSHAPTKTGRGLEVGCQWGVLLDCLAGYTTLRWWGVDPVIGRHRSRSGWELFNGFADDLPFGDSVFDCVVLANVYEHIDPDRRAASLREIRRVLVPGGILVGQLPNPHFPLESHSKLPFMGWLPPRWQDTYWKLSPARRGPGFHSVTIRDLRRRAERAGFERLLVRNFSYPPEAAPTSVRWLARVLERPMKVMPWAWQFVFSRSR